MKQQRDKQGKFLPFGKVAEPRKHFNQRYIKAGELQDKIESAFLDGFEMGRKLKGTVSANQALRAWLADK